MVSRTPPRENFVEELKRRQIKFQVKKKKTKKTHTCELSSDSDALFALNATQTVRRSVSL